MLKKVQFAICDLTYLHWSVTFWCWVAIIRKDLAGDTQASDTGNSEKWQDKIRHRTSWCNSAHLLTQTDTRTSAMMQLPSCPKAVQRECSLTSTTVTWPCHSQSELPLITPHATTVTVTSGNIFSSNWTRPCLSCWSLTDHPQTDTSSLRHAADRESSSKIRKAITDWYSSWKQVVRCFTYLFPCKLVSWITHFLSLLLQCFYLLLLLFILWDWNLVLII